MTPPVDDETAPEDGRVGGESLAPSTVAEQRDTIPAGATLLLAERPPERRRHLEHREQGGRDAQDVDSGAAGAPAEPGPVRVIESDGRDRLRPLSHVEEVGRGDAHLHVPLPDPPEDVDQPVAVVEGKRSQEVAAQGAESRRGHTQAERERDDRGQRIGRSAQQGTQCVAQIVGDVAHGSLPIRAAPSKRRAAAESPTKRAPSHQRHRAIGTTRPKKGRPSTATAPRG
jgi:hypothetical protein